MVWSYNESNKNSELKKVVSTSVNDAKSLVLINLGNIKIECTLEHPFYVNGNWVEAKDLKAGDELLTKDGKLSTITLVTIEEKSEKVYNFEIEDNHNYYVSEYAVLVHNTCWKERLAKFMEYASKINPKSLKSQDDTIKHLENVFTVLDKSRTDDRILKLVGETNVVFKDGVKTIYQAGSAKGGNYTKVFPNGGFQIFKDHKIIINKLQ